jgi:hypothetical protein
MATTEPRWDVPGYYGYADAIDAMGSISAPLLAGISIALATLVISSADAFHWVSATLFLLVGATFSFVGCVQLTFRARQFVVTPSQIEEWWPNHEQPSVHERLRREQRYHHQEYKKWARLARSAYNVGVLAFVLGIAALLVPKPGIRHMSDGRLTVFVLALAAFACEVAWISWTALGAGSKVKDYPPPPAPET